MTGSVAVVGAGPGGLVAARWLLSQGFYVDLFEEGPTLGGQWSGRRRTSGVWPAMHTNTSRILTAFSDLDHDADVVFPSNHEVLAYLHRYAETFDLTRRIRLCTHVDLIDREEDRWRVEHAGTVEIYDRVVIATGRFRSPSVPPVPGLETFTGTAMSTFRYRGADEFRGKRVLVAGCAVSALEIAAELAQSGAAHVAVTQRRQRYVLPKFAAGVPSDHRIFTRFGALAATALPPSEVDRQLREIVVEVGGAPEQYGAPAADPSLFRAGVTLNQTYLPLVAEGRIAVRPWMGSVDGAQVTFGDGSTDEFDAIIFGTGFSVDIPFLSDEVREALDVDDAHIDADRYTFHPDLPGLALMGMWDQSGGYFVPLELQARWIAYAWGGAVPMLSDADQREAVAAYRARRGQSQKTRMNLAATMFARAARVEPTLEDWPEMERALLFGPLAPSCFRLEGPDALPDAPEWFLRDAAAFGAITGPELTARECEYRAMLQAARETAAVGG